MNRTLIAVFDSPDHAHMARSELLQLGVPEGHINIHSASDGDVGNGSMAQLFGLDDEEASRQYSQAMSQGSCVVSVDSIGNDLIARASRIMSDHGAVDMNERVIGWGEGGDARRDQPAQRTADSAGLPGGQSSARSTYEASADDTAIGARKSGTGETSRIPVVEENLDIGKHEVEQGKVRVFTRVTERPVEEQVALREEHARVTRHPVDREVTGADAEAAFTEKSLEIRETREQPVVRKSARVVEEVEVGKEVSERIETVKDTVRRSDVEVEDIPASRPAGSPRESDKTRRR